MSPGDVRTLRASQLARNANGAMFFTARGKTGVPVGGALSDRALAALQAYIGRLGVDLHGEAYNRSGGPYSSDTLGDDFRDVRRLVFGDRENRTLRRGRGHCRRGQGRGTGACHGQHAGRV